MKHFITKIEIQLLMNATARAFHHKPRRVWTLPCADALPAYAACTRDWLLRYTGDPAAIQAEMYREALRLGRLVRRLTFFLSDQGHARLVFALYRGIGITMQGQLPGEVQVSRCCFSSYYTPEMCRLIAAMDDGVVSGIMGGRKLRFSQRITEGCACCKAHLTRRDTDE